MNGSEKSVEKPKNLTKETPSADAATIKLDGKQRWAALYEEEKRMVRGRFDYKECPGGVMEFSYRKYKQDPLTKYSLKDGEVYTIPLYVARHLNKECSFPTYTFKNDEAGRPQTTVAERVHRTGFQSLDFL
jgi:hypothetical protein